MRWIGHRMRGLLIELLERKDGMFGAWRGLQRDASECWMETVRSGKAAELYTISVAVLTGVVLCGSIQ